MLFSSRVRSRILSLLILGGEGGMSTRAIAGKVKAQYSRVWSELRQLERAGLLRSDTAGRMMLFRVNPDWFILPELRTMLIKTDGLGDAVRKALSGFPVKAAFVYGSFTNGTADLLSDVDLMIIGETRMEKLTLAIRRLEKELGRTVNYSAFPVAQWREKVAQGDAFPRNVMAGPKQRIPNRSDSLAIHGFGNIKPVAFLGGLHHSYSRVSGPSQVNFPGG
jgi:predicted nucleotidyltransferase